jgi:hypothetical protein
MDAHAADAAATIDAVATLDWPQIARNLDELGYALLPNVLPPAECDWLTSLYACDDCFRTRVIMARHRFGRGEYKYFASPLPPLVAALREALFPPVSAIANRWNEAMGIDVRFPDTLARFLDRCHRANQTRPTPLLLRYEAGDYNCLHQDVYGELVFPLQAAFLLAAPGEDFTGGEFVLAEQRPRAQSIVQVVPLTRGDGVLFPVRHRPVRGTRGHYRASIRHGVSRIRSGRRFTLGIIFHDAT